MKTITVDEAYAELNRLDTFRYDALKRLETGFYPHLSQWASDAMFAAYEALHTATVAYLDKTQGPYRKDLNKIIDDRAELDLLRLQAMSPRTIFG